MLCLFPLPEFGVQRTTVLREGIKRVHKKEFIGHIGVTKQAKDDTYELTLTVPVECND